MSSSPRVILILKIHHNRICSHRHLPRYQKVPKFYGKTFLISTFFKKIHISGLFAVYRKAIILILPNFRSGSKIQPIAGKSKLGRCNVISNTHGHLRTKNCLNR